MTQRLSVTVEDEVAKRLERLRAEERRPESQMAAILIEEALAAREKAKADA